MPGWTFMPLAAALCLTFLALLIAGIVWLVFQLPRRPGALPSRPPETIDERFARGEIKAEEYREGRKAIARGRSRVAGWATTAGIALIVVGLLGSVVAATTSIDSEAVTTTMRRQMAEMMRDGHMGDMMGGETERRAPSAEAGAPTERVVAGDLYFRPRELRLPAGSLNIRFTNSGRVFHTFTIRELDFDLRAGPGATISGALRDVRPGTYEAVCTVPGHAQAGMRATVTVTQGS